MLQLMNLHRALFLCVYSAVIMAAAIAADPKTIELWPEGVPGLRADATPEKIEDARASNVHHPYVAVFPAPADKAVGTAVIICPGGGYVRLSIENEGSLIAARLNALGVSAFVLHYRLVEYGHPAPLRDVLRAIRLVRSRAAEFGVKPDRIGVLGASAGGHLAASAATLFNDPDGKTGAALDVISARPDFATLLYPVITMKDPFVHAGSRQALLGPAPAPAAIEHLSLESRVTKETPPTFIVATEDDKSVPVENSLMFYQALRNAGVPAELHLWPTGPHGFGMRPDLPGPSSWTDRLEEWLRNNHWLTAPAH
jgi:acetyl esterase/lipase